MKLKDIKVGQIVRHTQGFLAEVKEIDDEIITLEITDSGASNRVKGDSYVALSKYIALVADVDTNTKNSTNMVINVEVNGLEKFREELVDVEDALMGVRAEAEALAETVKADTVFTAEMGEGISFKGTKSDFEAFIKGMSQMVQLGNKE